MILRHLKLFILILMELALLLFMAAGSFGDAGAKSFVPSDFYDNVRGRTNISVNEDGAHFEYDPKLVIRNDEGDVMGDDLLTGKFALGSGAYILSVDYKAEASNAYVELYSLNALTEPVSEKIYLTPDRGHTWGKIYVPFARSLHDIQMNIHYTGPGRLTVYGIDLREDVSYRWVPLAGYLLLFIFLDPLFEHLFGNVDRSSADLLEIDFFFDDVTYLAVRIDLDRLGIQDIEIGTKVELTYGTTSRRTIRLNAVRTI